ncbi:MAG: DUF2911 domain-containing protein [Bacteroidetes bacterium]|nr:MAG: DUF2911 domain-containing protein [Bacteroidota bacterium]TAG94275.1 MAG: DUF2911 domain-containing protein [Bacteroidota bacterium]
MKKKIIFLTYVFNLLVVLTTIITPLQAQKTIQPRSKASPICLANFVGEDNNYVKVTYGQPMKKGREIFGNLVPYGKIWRTGANEATEVTFTKDVVIEKKNIKAGTYTVFSIPEEDKWTIIFNGVLGQWGSYKYEENKSQNVAEISIPVDKAQDEYEAFTIQFEQTKKGAEMILFWDKTKIAIPIVFKKGK